MSVFNLPWPGQPSTGSAPNSQVVRENLIAIAQFLNALDGGNLIAGSIPSSAFDTNTNPVTRWQENFINFVSAGGLPGGFTLLAVTSPSGVAYVSGIRIAFSSQGFTLPINSDNYIYVTSTGSQVAASVANGAAQPALPANATWLWKAVTNGTTVTGSIIDLRSLSPVGGQWTPYTPAWTSSGVAPAIGNGTLVGSYQQIGKTVHFRIKWVVGSTTTGGTSSWRFSLPVTPSTVEGTIPPGGTGGFAVGTWYGENPGVLGYGGLVRMIASSLITLEYVAATAGAMTDVTNAAPASWATNWYILVHGTYEAA